MKFVKLECIWSNRWTVSQTDLHKWYGWPLPSGYLAYRGIFTGGNIENRALSSGSMRDAIGSVGWNRLYTWQQCGFWLPVLQSIKRLAANTIANGLPNMKKSPTSKSKCGTRDSLVDDDRRRGVGAVNNFVASNSGSNNTPCPKWSSSKLDASLPCRPCCDDRHNASCANIAPIESPIIAIWPLNPLPSSDLRKSAYAAFAFVTVLLIASWKSGAHVVNNGMAPIGTSVKFGISDTADGDVSNEYGLKLWMENRNGNLLLEKTIFQNEIYLDRMPNASVHTDGQQTNLIATCPTRDG